MPIASRAPRASDASTSVSKVASVTIGSSRKGIRSDSSVPEVPPAGEHRREALLVGGLDHLLVVHRSARLHYGGPPSRSDRVKTVPKWEECVRGDGGSFQVDASLRRL